MIQFKLKKIRLVSLLTTIFLTTQIFNNSQTSVFAKTEITSPQKISEYPIHFISIEQIAEKLKGKAPIDVGFDVDDTLLFSTPGFLYGQQLFSPGNDDYLKKNEFWNRLSNGWDVLSIPKKSAVDLVKMHLERGDRIWFITARFMPIIGKEILTDQLAKSFSVPPSKLNKVIFTGDDKNAKIQYIRNLNIKIYYGDSDSDIIEAREGGAEAIRIMRSVDSIRQPLPANGALGEKVLINSDYY